MQIYLARDKVQAGPYTLDEVNRMLASGEVWLDDLMWHAGMEQWQRIGDLTDNQMHYTPTSISQKINEPKQIRSFGDNPEFNEPKRISVAELYGRQQKDEITNKAPIQDKLTTHIKSAASTEIVYASVMSRFLAMLINVLLFVVALIPFLQAFITLNPDPQKMNAGDLAERMAYAQELAASMPAQAGLITGLLLFGYLIIQFLLIILRGQSFGKLAVGIRVVDAKTWQKPSFLKGVLLRVGLLLVVYWLLMSLPFVVNLAFIALSVNYLMAANHQKKQGWHDRLAGTVVIKSKSATPENKAS